jgi:hypothetical protein
MIRFIAIDETDRNHVGNDAANVADRDEIPIKSDDAISTNVHAVAGANRIDKGVSHETLCICLSLLTSFLSRFLIYLRLFVMPVFMIWFTDKDETDGNGGAEKMVDDTSQKPLMGPQIESVASMNLSATPIHQLFHNLTSSMAGIFQLINGKLGELTAQLIKIDDQVSKLVGVGTTKAFAPPEIAAASLTR